MLRIGICDDEETMCHLIESAVLEISGESGFSADTEVFFSGKELSDYLNRGGRFDVIFLDIEMDGMNGIDISEKIRTDMDDTDTEIVYVTCTTAYDRKLFDYHPLAFIAKPVDKGRLARALGLARRRRQSRNPLFSFTSGRKTYTVPYEQILYFESADRKIDVICREETYSYYGRLSDVRDVLPGFFCQVHRSYIVNTRQIDRYGGREITMRNGQNITIGKNYREAFLRCQLAEAEGL